MRTNTINYLSEILLNSLEGNVCILDREYRFLYFNNAFAKNYLNAWGEEPKLHEVDKIKDASNLLFDRLKIGYDKAFKGIPYEIKENAFHIKFTPIPTVNNLVCEVLVQFKNYSNALFTMFDTHFYTEQKYQEVINNISDIVFQTDQDWNWTFLNESWRRVLGYSLEESLGKPYYDFMHPEDADKKDQLFETLILQKKTSSKHVARFISKSGEIKWIKATVSFIYDDKGYVVGATGTLQDITKQKENAHIYELLSNNVKDLVCIHDLNGYLLYLSPSIKQITGYEPIDLIGKKMSDFYHPEDLRKTTEDEDETPISTTYRFQKKNGEYIWLETNSKVFFDDYDLTYRIITSTREISDRKKTEEILMNSLNKERELNDLKSLFVNVASHEFRTPLATIRSSTEIIQMIDKDKNPNILKHVNIISSQIDRITNLMNEILIVGKIESKKLTANKEKINIMELVKNSVESQNALQKDGRRIQFNVFGLPQSVNVDPLHLTLIVDNLASNALKYSKGRPNPVVVLNFNENHFEIKIQDFGIGIPLEGRNKIFNTFYRANNVGRIEGTGLGLVIAKNLVELNGGKLKFESEENIGSTFIIYFSYL
ncbi:PAS domain-containing sensor histidine kinase [Arcicella rigui]|uniref:histidine kinase n=1 Tax=Arcicella rigui TaxID=797020 RepID=A0ABU5QA44_9BACT|nr:PAS domain-containing sensor histidine kinase [Arcicella rigui]MEA5139705.1 PAS domain-containing sensor histidine kinase [Arcicella rigui]